ncbi:response regulator transcription factor [Leptolyngbya ohadii]|uniref:response regulator transcription factor n=1 Tax=Leptolyngbya ohadii TaxID=1962290 RepID=UPI000B5A1DF5|nr:response regulator transcription factor [Leptolyngbya ohadii]
MRILLVEDDRNLAAALTTLLNRHNYLLDVSTDGEMGWEMINIIDYDLVLLDVELPKLDGISLCRRLREHHYHVPVMLMTVRDSVTDKSVGLDSGADDYLVKPFDIQELLARIRVLSRRLAERSTTVLSCGKLRLDPKRREISYDGQVLPFSRKEFLLIELFLRHPHRVFSRGDIVDHLWSLDNLPTEDTVKSHIRRIRRKLSEFGAEDLIETLYGHGYRLNPAFASSESEDTLTPVQEKELKEAIGQVWQNIRSGVWEQLAILKQTILDLEAGNCVEQERIELARQIAHQIAGTVGTCGFEAASHITRAIETLLQQPLYLKTLYSLSHLVKVLSWELEQPIDDEVSQANLAVSTAKR